MKIPELYYEDLETLKKALDSLEILTNMVVGAFAVEIRVKVDDVSTWAVIGWGESMDPCVLRFEKDIVTPPINTGFHPTVPGITWNRPLGIVDDAV